MSKMTYARLRAEYADLWATLKFRPKRETRASDTAAKIVANRDRYEAVAAEVGAMPWPVVGLIHAMESGLDFDKHLHNGDPLTARTKRVPANRPTTGSAPFTWHQSAVDALKMKQLGRVKDWSAERIAFECERYNGFGYRLHHPHVLSPYLWAGTTHYSRGKYVADGSFSDRAVSRQTGAMALLRAVLDLVPDALDPTVQVPNSGRTETAVHEASHAAQLPKPNPPSDIVPLFRPKQSDAVTRAVLAKFSDLTPEDRRGDAVRVLMVRGYYADTMGEVGRNDRAVYDDALFVVTPDGVQPFNANSDPSVWRDRVATIKAGQAIRYRPGLHGYSRKAGPYPAFRQDAPCVVERDGHGDDTGLFHVNLHRGGAGGTSSLGCLTVPPHQWGELHTLLTGVLNLHGQDTFFVTLVEYDGDEPPVSASQIEAELLPADPPADPDKFTGEDAWSLVAGGAILAAITGWWDTVTAMVGGLF